MVRLGAGRAPRKGGVRRPGVSPFPYHDWALGPGLFSLASLKQVRGSSWTRPPSLVRQQHLPPHRIFRPVNPGCFFLLWALVLHRTPQNPCRRRLCASHLFRWASSLRPCPICCLCPFGALGAELDTKTAFRAHLPSSYCGGRMVVTGTMRAEHQLFLASPGHRRSGQDS